MGCMRIRCKTAYDLTQHYLDNTLCGINVRESKTDSGKIFLTDTCQGDSGGGLIWNDPINKIENKTFDPDLSRMVGKGYQHHSQKLQLISDVHQKSEFKFLPKIINHN